MTYVVVNAARVRRVFGRLGLPWMMRLANRVLANASARCNVRTGELRASLYTEVKPRTVRVGSHLPYAKFVHNGTAPHMIFPNPPRQFLRFQGRGGVVFARQVSHPGYKGNPFLREAMREEVGRR